MRNSLAKKLRREAERLTEGKPNVGYKIGNEAKKVKTKDGKIIPRCGSIQLVDGCTRKVYKLLKQGKLTIANEVQNAGKN